jgi:hypothetical protein
MSVTKHSEARESSSHGHDAKRAGTVWGRRAPYQLCPVQPTRQSVSRPLSIGTWR